jgi:two-component sensor histidine kinase
MVKSELRPYDGMGQRVTLSGPPVELAAELAVPTSMALHELATNAVRFGALSLPEGQISVEWDVVQSEGKRKLHLIWIEQGGPPVEQPTRCGFGMLLLQRVLAAQCQAEVRLEFARSGLQFEMTAPMIEYRTVPPY